MEITAEQKARIDSLNIKELLAEFRFMPIGDERFQGDQGQYLMDRLSVMRAADPPAFIQASKDLGWMRP